MLIDKHIIKSAINSLGIDLTGILHIGAHDCEELDFYKHFLGIHENNVVWLEAIQSKVTETQKRGIPNVYQAIVSDEDDKIVDFHISNNGQSSSLLEMKTHLEYYPEVVYTEHFQGQTITIDTFLEKNCIDPAKLVFWNIDIQGAELLALKGAKNALKYAKILYLEINEQELYKDCALLPELDLFLQNHGFKCIKKDMCLTGIGNNNAGWGDAMYIRT